MNRTLSLLWAWALSFVACQAGVQVAVAEPRPVLQQGAESDPKNDEESSGESALTPVLPQAEDPTGPAPAPVPVSVPAPVPVPLAAPVLTPVEPPLIDLSGGVTAPPGKARSWSQAPGVEDEDIALAVPRAVLFVPKLVLAVVAWPIVQAVKLVDEWRLLERFDNILYFDQDHHAGWGPVLSFQNGFGPTLGLKVFHKSLFGHDENLKLSARYWGRYSQAYAFSLEANRLGGSRVWFESRARYEAEKGSLFGGIGIPEDAASGANLDPRASNRIGYFSQARFFGSLRLGYTAGETGGLVKTGLSLIANRRSFARNRVGKTDIEAIYDTALIPGFEQGIDTLEFQANVVLDYRVSGGLDSRGAYFETFGGYVPGLSNGAFWHYGAELSYTFDLFRATRLLTLRTGLEAVEGKTGQIAFTELPRLGGANRLRGYGRDRFRDRRATFASLEYHYPIHKNVHGELFLDTGYAAQRYRDLYQLESWKVGYGGGLILGSADSVSFRFEVSYGDALQVFLTSDLARAFEGRESQL